MRAIDADALMKAMYHRAFETDGDTMWQSGCWVRYRAIEQVVKEQPTIEPERKTGKWNVYYHGDNDFSYSCRECGYSAPYNMIGGMVFQKKWAFCPNCGAEMREGEQE